MRVEVYVEDNFYQSSQSTDAPISSQIWENWFQHWMESLQPDVPPAEIYEIGLRLTDDTEIQALNAQYRHQNKPTDVLSFAALETDLPITEESSTDGLYLGDIVISVDTAVIQAQQQQHPLLTELSWLAAHGLLHLLGWDHPDEEKELQMLKRQVLLLKTIGIDLDIE